MPAGGQTTRKRQAALKKVRRAPSPSQGAALRKIARRTPSQSRAIGKRVVGQAKRAEARDNRVRRAVRGRANVAGGDKFRLPLGVGTIHVPAEATNAYFAALSGSPSEVLRALKGATPVAGRLGKNAVQDTLDLPGNTASTAYHVGDAAVSLAQGKSKKAEDLWKGLKKNDPLALALQGKFEKAGKQAFEHPVSTGLELYGVKGALGRGAGKAMRSGALGKAAKAAGSVQRDTIRVPGSRAAVKREWSPDVSRKAVQVARAKRAEGRSVKLQGKALQARAAGHEDKALSFEKKARAKDPARVKPSEVRRQANELVDLNEQLRRRDAAVVDKAVKDSGVEKTGAAGAMVAQAVVKDAATLKAYIARLKGEREHLGPSAKRQNRLLVQQLEKSLQKGQIADLAKVNERIGAYRKIVGEQQKRLVASGALDAEQAARAELIPHGAAVQGARHTGDSFPLSTGDMKASVKAGGYQDPVFLSHAPNARGAGNFYRDFASGPHGVKKGRTGEAVVQGRMDAGSGVFREQARRNQSILSANEGFARYVTHFGHRKGGDHGKGLETFSTHKTASAKAADLEAQTGFGWRPVKIHPFGASKEQVAKLLEGEDVKAQQGLMDSLDAALSGKPDPGYSGRWVLVPEEAATTIQQHLKVLGPNTFNRSLQAATNAFRQTVLPTSTRWMAGNIAEGYVRRAVNRAGPRSPKTATKVIRRLKEIDPKAAKELEGRVLSGGMYSQASRQPRRYAEQFQGSGMAGPARVAGTVARAPGFKQALTAYRLYSHFVMDTVNRRFEVHTQKAHLGAEIRRAMPANIRKLSDTAIDEAARGLRNTEAQVKLGRAVDEAYGRYSKFSPGTRQAIAGYTPFIPWYLSSVNFLFHVLPRDHPVLVGLAASAARASEDWRREHGLVKGMGKGELPGFLMGTAPVSGGGHVPLARYTPLGALNDPLGNAANSVLPQISGILDAFQARDWKGNKLKDQTDLGKIGAAGESVLSGFIPFYQAGSRVAKGESADKILNPLHPYASGNGKKKVRRSSGSGGGWGSG